MELRIRSSLPVLPGRLDLGLAVLLGALLAALWAGASPAAARAKAPTVTSVSPMKAEVGDRLTIRGRNFRAGKGRNTVVFKRDGGRALFVRSDLSTRKLIRVTVPARLETLLPVRDGARQYARFRIRVLAGKLGRSFTPLSRSPRLGMPIAADADCDGDGRTNRADGDDDNDLLADALESRYRLVECDADTDNDGVGDGFEFASARDLNDDEYQGANTAIPYPTARPYPNPLDGKDANTDFDGDSLTLAEEHGLWRYALTGRAGASGAALSDPALLNRFSLLDTLAYSDGEQYSIHERCPSAANPPPAARATAVAASRRWPRRDTPSTRTSSPGPSAPATARCSSPTRRRGGISPSPATSTASSTSTAREPRRRPRPATSTPTATASSPTTSATRTPTGSATSTRPTAACSRATGPPATRGKRRTPSRTPRRTSPIRTPTATPSATARTTRTTTTSPT
jgi:hypothetical protein